mmetsp:Transcript_19708/g.39220  ORF Transcript_19708/g.39220 Transcript_19708/m.39220 type:complete len:204 (-) Transcript_19708:494-1105(-)
MRRMDWYLTACSSLSNFVTRTPSLAWRAWYAGVSTSGTDGSSVPRPSRGGGGGTSGSSMSPPPGERKEDDPERSGGSRVGCTPDDRHVTEADRYRLAAEVGVDGTVSTDKLTCPGADRCSARGEDTELPARAREEPPLWPEERRRFRKPNGRRGEGVGSGASTATSVSRSDMLPLGSCRAVAKDSPDDEQRWDEVGELEPVRR